MVELKVRSPLAGYLWKDRYGPAEAPAGLTLIERGRLAVLEVMARQGRGNDVAERLGVRLPERVNSVAETPLGTCFCLRPESWLFVREDAAGRRGGAAHELARTLDGMAAVVDQSHARAVLRVSGPAAREVLQKGIAVELSAGAFPPGAMLQSGIAGIALLCHALEPEPTFDLYHQRSFALSLLDWFEDIGGAYGIECPATQ